MPRQLAPQLEVFKFPEYNDTGSLEVFIRQFLDVTKANNWGERAALLHPNQAELGKKAGMPLQNHANRIKEKYHISSDAEGDSKNRWLWTKSPIQ